MDRAQLHALLAAVAAGRTPVEDAVRALDTALATTPAQTASPSQGFVDLGFAKLDTERSRRRGFPEVIFCSGKTPAQVVAIAERLRRSEPLVLCTRVNTEQLAALRTALPDLRYFETARLVSIAADAHTGQAAAKGEPVAVVTAGTSDLPVAEEAAVTAELFGQKVTRIFDVGVAGLHRVIAQVEVLRAQRVIVCVAGMDGALPSVVAGLVACPVIAVPTSVGYGASFAGIGPLLTMLASCSPGIAVVNIDNGFGAGYLAALMNRPAANPGAQAQAAEPNAAARDVQT